MKRNFTLVEILAVVAVIAILGTIGFAGYSYATNASKESATKATIARIAAALEAAKMQSGFIPPSSSYQPIVIVNTTKVTFGGTDYAKTTDFYKSFIKEIEADSLSRCLNSSNQLTDGWGNPIYYRFPGKINRGSFDLISGGADGWCGQEALPDPPPEPGTTGFLNLLEEKTINSYRDSNGEWVCDDIANF